MKEKSIVEKTGIKLMSFRGLGNSLNDREYTIYLQDHEFLLGHLLGVASIKIINVTDSRRWPYT